MPESRSYDFSQDKYISEYKGANTYYSLNFIAPNSPFFSITFLPIICLLSMKIFKAFLKN